MIDKLITEAARLFEIEPAELLGRSRRRPAVEARQAVAHVAYMRGGARVGLGMEGIGIALHRDHTTIVYAVAEAERRAVERSDYALKLCALMQAV